MCQWQVTRQPTHARNPKWWCCWTSLRCLPLDFFIHFHRSDISCSVYPVHHSADEKLHTKAGQRNECFIQRVPPGAHNFPQPLVVHIFPPCRLCSSTEHHCLFISKLASIFFLPQSVAHRTRSIYCELLFLICHTFNLIYFCSPEETTWTLSP